MKIKNLLVVSLISGISVYANQDIIIEDTNYQNNGSLNGQVIINSENTKLINTGKIQNEKNGIYSEKTIESLENNGVIKSGNGIYIKSNNIGIIKNHGLILGRVVIDDSKDNSSDGNGINLEGKKLNPSGIFQGEINKIENTGVIKGEGEVSSEKSITQIENFGNGINISSKNLQLYYSSYRVAEIDNVGKIKGDVKLSGKAIRTENSGNGISNYTNLTNNVENIKNDGFISGNVFIDSKETIGMKNSGNGIASSSVDYVADSTGKIENIDNKGLISGNITANIEKDKSVDIYSSGNGISNYGRSNLTEIKSVKNSGNISGNVIINKSEVQENSTTEKIIFSGNGIMARGILESIENQGVIKGSKSSISTGDLTNSKIEIVKNYGVLAGTDIFSKSPDYEDNKGTYVYLKNRIGSNGISLDRDGDVEIEKIVYQSIKNNMYNEKEILNAASIGNDSYILVKSDTHQNNKIINGAGIKNGVLTVSPGKNLKIDNSVINGYKTAITLENNSSLIAYGSTFNGGGLKGDNATIDIKGNNTKIDILGKSFLNGKIIANGNDGEIYIENSVLVNGDMISTGDRNKLNLGSMESKEELKIYHEIKDFDEINTNGKVTFYETSKVNSKNDINIAHGTLMVRVNGSERDNKGRVTGHALYNHKGEIILGEMNNIGDHLPEGDNHPDIKLGAKLFFKASGLQNGTVIAMNGTDISNLQDWEIGTYSIAHTARKFISGYDDHLLLNNTISNLSIKDSSETVDIVIGVLNLDEILVPENPKDPELEVENKEDLGDIWDSIVNGKEEDKLSPTLDIEDGKSSIDGKRELVSILDQIYANNPYSYVGEASRESMRLYQDSIITTKMPKRDEWIVEGHGIYGYNKFAKSNRKIKYKSNLNTAGMLGTLEYGVTENSSLGIAIGGLKQNLNMSKGTDLEGNSGYVGIYGKRNVDKFRFIGGVGYQYNNYNVDRVLSNEYQTLKNNGEISSDGIGTYLEVRYFVEDKTKVSFEPKARISYTYISQESIKEKKNPLAIDVEGENYQNAEIEIGLDIIKKKYLTGGILNFIGGVNYIKILGADENYLVGRIKDSTNFKIKGPKISENKVKVTIGIDYEKNKGVFYNLYTDLELGEKERNNLNIKLGVGYRF